jgi:hypothetical protein
VRLGHFALGLLFGMLLAVLAAVLATPSAAALTINGDWTVTTADFYADDTITVVANGSAGNVYILAGAELHLNNITLILPNNRTLDNQGYLEVVNSTIRSPGWLLYLRGAADLTNVSLFNVSRDIGGGVSGTYISNSSVNLNGVRWMYTVMGFGQRDWFIHIRVIMDFSGNYVGRRGQVIYELPTISGNANITVANNRFQLGAGFGMGSERTTGLVITNALHTGLVTFDIHDNNFTDGDDGIAFGSSSSSTTYLVHDNTFVGSGSTSLEVGQGAAADRFGGVLSVWNMTLTNVNRAMRLSGTIGTNITAVAENVTIVSNAGGMFGVTGIVANEATWLIRNSSVSMRAIDTQYQSESNGHIKIFTTVDRALSGVAVTQTGASVEHFAFLNVLGATWQNSVSIVGDLVLLREATGNLSLTIDPQTWSPREIVWWGLYYQAPQVDNRDLRPEIQDGGHKFGCLPTPFLVTDPMAALSIVCTDDVAPTISVFRPAANRLQNTPTLLANGSGSEYGSGINTLEWSLNNASWGPVTQGSGPMDWSLAATALTDGVYTLYLRAVDRTGLSAFKSVTGITIDMTPPTLDIPALVDFSSLFLLNISGNTEALASVTYVLGSSLPVSTTAASDGTFSFPNIALSEGHNTLWVTAVDAAGNAYSIQRNITVDSVPPSLAVAQGQNILTPETSFEFTGLSEPTAVVRVNGAATQRIGDAFSYTLSLVPGVNLVTITSTDGAGNRASWYGVVVSDNDLPVLVASIDTGNTTADGASITRAGAVPVTGRATDATTPIANVTINGTVFQVDSTGAFQMSLAVPEGESTVRVSATDLAGNTAVVTLRVLRDSTAPQAVDSLEAADSLILTLGTTPTTRGSFVTVVLTMSEAGQATVGGVSKSVTAGPNSFNISLAEGTNSISISFRDRAGNPGTSKTVTVERDTTPPELTIASPANGTEVAGDTATVTGSAEPGAEVLVNGARATLTSGTFTTNVPVLSGATTTITVVASDAMGNSNSVSVHVTRKASGVVTTNGDSTTSILMLLVGIAAGVAVGFVVRGRSRAKSEVAAAEARTSGAEETGAPPAQAQVSRGPKGPRGPAPPPQ